MTGRAAGYCAGYPVPGYMNPYGGRGFWGRGGGRGFWGRGGGRGRRNWYYATGLTGWQRAAYGYPAWGYGVGPVGYPAVPFEPAPEQELSALKQQAEQFQSALEDINERIKELETEKPKEKK
jgi:hypothetical protein